MRKSRLYDEFRFAVKFVNKERVAYPQYFERAYYQDGTWQLVTLPMGRIQEDMGPVENDFRYDDSLAGASKPGEDTDQSTSRAFRVAVNPGSASDDCIDGVCVTHETGLEVFLVSAATFIGMETAKYSLKRLLEQIEQSINTWMRSRKHRPAPPEVEREPTVQHIALRTASWEITLDGRFTIAEREAVLDYMGSHLVPDVNVEDYLGTLSDHSLRQKTLAATRRVISW